MRLQIRRPRRQPNATETRLLNQTAKHLAVLGVSIHEEVARFAQESIQGIGEVAAHLHHPGFCGLAGAAGEDEEQQLPRLQNRLHIPPDAV